MTTVAPRTPARPGRAGGPAGLRLATGIRSGPLFPRADGKPWRSHDWKNWTRRVWHVARERAGIESLPPYDLRHACASLQVRAGLSIPELAEQMGHSPAMTLNTYAHVIRELKGLSRSCPPRSRSSGRAETYRDASGTSAPRPPMVPDSRNGGVERSGETRTRTGDTTIFSRVLYQLSYLAVGA